ncbi:MAG TPA: hypothetical protein VHE30_10635 [Polyangiaceae bacterium]|nr:hypothetical protein [Polyangiaceae bacterium]
MTTPTSAESRESDQCLTCYGTGEIVTEGGASICPDCLGHQRAPRGTVMEWRLRDLERAHASHTTGCSGDVAWLVHELRRHREALVEILTLCQEQEGDEPRAVAEIRHLSNEALGLYRVEKA